MNINLIVIVRFCNSALDKKYINVDPEVLVRYKTYTKDENLSGSNSVLSVLSILGIKNLSNIKSTDSSSNKAQKILNKITFHI